MLFFNRPSMEDLYEFFYVWQMYEEIGVPSREAVAEFEKSATKPAVRAIMQGIQKEVRQGASMADAMKKYPDFFPAYIVEMVRVGEHSGQMGKILSTLVFALGYEMDMGKDVGSALWTPTAFLILLLVAFVLVVGWILPKMGEIFSEIGGELPWYTKLVLSFGEFLAAHWFLVLALVLLLGWGIYALLKARPDIRDRIRLHMPIFGKIHNSQMQFRLASVFGMCLEANVQLQAAIRYAADASGNYFMRGTLMAALRRMEASGMSFADALQAVNVYAVVSPQFLLMLRVGSNGNLGEIMLHLAEREQKNLVRYTKEIGDKVSLFVFVPLSVALVLLTLAVELPMYSFGLDSNFTNF